MRPSASMRILSVNEPPEGFVNPLSPVVAPPYITALDVTSAPDPAVVGIASSLVNFLLID